MCTAVSWCVSLCVCEIKVSSCRIPVMEQWHQRPHWPWFIGIRIHMTAINLRPLTTLLALPFLLSEDIFWATSSNAFRFSSLTFFFSSASGWSRFSSVTTTSPPLHAMIVTLLYFCSFHWNATEWGTSDLRYFKGCFHSLIKIFKKSYMVKNVNNLNTAKQID